MICVGYERRLKREAVGDRYNMSEHAAAIRLLLSHEKETRTVRVGNLSKCNTSREPADKTYNAVDETPHENQRKSFLYPRNLSMSINKRCSISGTRQSCIFCNNRRISCYVIGKRDSLQFAYLKAITRNENRKISKRHN